MKVGNFSQAGGLVGSNQAFNNGDESYGIAKIINSFASGKVRSNGVNVSLGGLVGQNGPGGVIANSKASGNVKATGSPDQSGCNTDGGTCQFVDAGGLVGQNGGSIYNSSARGNVEVGSNSAAGGLVGWNGNFGGGDSYYYKGGGSIYNSSASGKVRSAA